MKGTLVKREDRYDLYNESDGSKIASTAPNPQSRLSIINCESIEKGYSIEEIDALFKKVPHTVQNEEDYWKCRAGFITGFQTAMEILGDKKFSEEDMRNAWDAALNQYLMFHEIPATAWREQHIQSLQQTEWDVVAITKNSRTGKIIKSESDLTWDEDGLCDSAVPVFDADGCLILKHEV